MKINENPKCINKNAGHLDLPTLSREKCPPSNENPAMGFCRCVDRDNIFGLKIYSMLNARNTKQFFGVFPRQKRWAKSSRENLHRLFGYPIASLERRA